ncbi:zinc finger protein on ecdysone puffs-like [Littorina saxatilis]|uniref:Uncharacterized protein n=1 Tax=Littorina saxatilis TaxID=31220 RepID=A0AAN9BC22_9CAEN
MATGTRPGTKRSVQPLAAPGPTSKKNSRQPTALQAPSPSRGQPSQALPAASRAQNGGTRAGSKAPGASKAASKAGTSQGTRASQKKPARDPVLVTVGSDGQIIVGDQNPEDEQEGEEYDDDEEDEEGEEEGEEEVVEEEEEEFDYSKFQYRPYQHYVREPDEPRVTIDTGPEGCSCFPSRSSRNIPSMIYEQIDCKHESLQGYAHLGVYRFDDNWDARHEAIVRPKLADRLMPNKGFVWGYPSFVFVEADEDKKRKDDVIEDEYDEEGGGEYDEEGEYEEGEGEYQEEGEYDEEGYDEEELPQEDEEELEREGYYDENGDYYRYLFEDAESLPSRMYDSKGQLLSRAREESVKPFTTAPKPSSALVAILPRIGFTPEPSVHASRVSTAAKTPVRTPSLPPITPTSAQGSREQTPVRFKPRTLHRTFRGKYYDPVTKESYEFEITPDYRRRIDRWHTKKEGLGRVGDAGPLSGRQTNATNAPSRASHTSEKRVVTKW